MEKKVKKYAALSLLLAAGATLTIIGSNVFTKPNNANEFKIDIDNASIESVLKNYQSAYENNSIDSNYGFNCYNYMNDLYKKVSDEDYDKNYLFGNNFTYNYDGESVKFDEKSSQDNIIYYKAEDRSLNKKIIVEDDKTMVRYNCGGKYISIVYNDGQYKFIKQYGTDFISDKVYGNNEICYDFNKDGSYKVANGQVTYVFDSNGLLKRADYIDGNYIVFNDGNLNSYKKYNNNDLILESKLSNGMYNEYKYYKNKKTLYCYNKDGSYNYIFVYENDELIDEKAYIYGKYGEYTIKEKEHNGDHVTSIYEKYDIFNNLALKVIDGKTVKRGSTKYIYKYDGSLDYTILNFRKDMEIYRNRSGKIFKVIEDGLEVGYYDYEQNKIEYVENLRWNERNIGGYILNPFDKIQYYESGLVRSTEIDGVVTFYFDSTDSKISGIRNKSNKEISIREFKLNKDDFVFFYDDDSVKESCLDGINISYFENHSIHSIENESDHDYKNGDFVLKPNDEIEYDLNGNIKLLRIDGVEKSYFEYPNSLNYVHNYSNNKIKIDDIILDCDDSISYNEDGSISIVKQHGICIWYYDFQNKQVKEYRYYGNDEIEIDGIKLKNGDEIAYDIDGNINSIEKDNVTVKYYNYEENKISSIRNNFNNKIYKVGDFNLKEQDEICFDENGKISMLDLNGVAIHYYDYESNKIRDIFNHSDEVIKHENFDLNKGDSIFYNEDGSVKEARINDVIREYYNYQNSQIRSIHNNSDVVIKYDNFDLNKGDYISYNEDGSIKETKINGVIKEYYNYQNNQIKNIHNNSDDEYQFGEFNLKNNEDIRFNEDQSIFSISKDGKQIVYYDYLNNKIRDINYYGDSECEIDGFTLHKGDSIRYRENGSVESTEINNILITYDQNGKIWSIHNFSQQPYNINNITLNYQDCVYYKEDGSIQSIEINHIERYYDNNRVVVIQNNGDSDYTIDGYTLGSRDEIRYNQDGSIESVKINGEYIESAKVR